MTSLSQHRRGWEDLGRVDPLWGVITWADKRHGRWDPAEFFATGERDIEWLMSCANQLGLPWGRSLALDFGCGVGRLTRPLAIHFQNYVGVDISESMLTQAREWNRDCMDCRFVLNTTDDLRIFESGSVDLIYSRYVLQHLPSTSLVESYLQEFVRILRRHGLLVFQLPTRMALLHRIQPRRRIYTLLRNLGVSEDLLLGKLELTPMGMRAISESKVHAFLTSLGATVVRTDHLSDLNHIYFVTR
jgi:ubiquinone/menaquinone biosynthesis C-methylase UbiE